MNPQTFVAKWAATTLNEKATAQEHFTDLCRLLGLPTPVEADPTGQRFRFEKPLSKAGGGAGFADVWLRDVFAWEYKTKGKYPNLVAAYQQLLIYRGDLGNPPILVACDIAGYAVHIDFPGHRTRVEQFRNEDLLNASTRELLHTIFTAPEALRPRDKTETITERVATDFAQVAQWVEGRERPEVVAPFFMKLLFAMFAEDIELLPNQVLTASLKGGIYNPADFNDMIRPLFQVMRSGGFWGPGNRIPQFNGGLFDDDDVVALKVDEIERLSLAAAQNWRDVEPAIFGTLFERSLDPAKRAELGAHYTGRADIARIVEPVLMAPLRAAWAATQAEIEALRPLRAAAAGSARQRVRHQVEGLLLAFMGRLEATTVLDPACGSGNFLYVALHALKDLEHEVITYAAALVEDAVHERPMVIEPVVGPRQLFGIERNPFAAELAQVVVWIGFLQWRRAHGDWAVTVPVLQTLDTIVCADALLTYDPADGTPRETPWPAATVIVGNPPFLGDKRMRAELGAEYVAALRALYAGRVPGGADLVTYWFERARAAIEAGRTARAGLLATNSIRNGANRTVLDRIKELGDIFMAWSDRAWVLAGAAVRVAMIGFDGGAETTRTLDGAAVATINADLTGLADVTAARPLAENAGLCFLGMMKGGPFDLDAATAQALLAAPNRSGRPNSEVIKRRINGSDIVRGDRGGWVIDFVERTEDEAAQYEAPFAYVREHVKPGRDANRDARMHVKWWLHGRSRPALRAAIATLRRCIVTPEVSKHRVFVWMDTTVIPDHKVHVIARDDDYCFGVLHSRIHEVWSLAQGSWMGVGNDPSYSSSRTFETFPFPWRPGAEPTDDPRYMAISEAARALVAARDSALAADPALTLTALYNRRPDWLTALHAALDAAVCAAYGWDASIDRAAILAALLALNGERGR